MFFCRLSLWLAGGMTGARDKRTNGTSHGTRLAVPYVPRKTRLSCARVKFQRSSRFQKKCVCMRHIGAQTMEQWNIAVKSLSIKDLRVTLACSMGFYGTCRGLSFLPPVIQGDPGECLG